MKNKLSLSAEECTYLRIMDACQELSKDLNAIIGIVNLLKLNYPPDQEVYITNLVFSSNYLLQLLNDILNLNRMGGSYPEYSAYANKFKGLRVLLVEDTPVNAMVAQDLLKYLGAMPYCAKSGKDALLLLQQNSYDVAFLDLHMPEMDGYALSAIMRQQYPDIHIVIFTADIMLSVKRRFAKMCIFDILHKPFHPQEILSPLLKVMQARKMDNKN